VAAFPAFWLGFFGFLGSRQDGLARAAARRGGRPGGRAEAKKEREKRRNP